MVYRVVNPGTRATDPTLLGHLVRSGIDSDYVELISDYTKNRPYAKLYRDQVTNRLFQVISGLPMVRSDGIKVEVGWNKIGNTFVAKPNQFKADIVNGAVSLAAINNQPDGRKATEITSWNPRLFVGAVEYTGGTPQITDDDLNPNYTKNVLVWDYGVAFRRIRLIEGHFREKWVFPSNPGGDIRIEHNLNGRVRLGIAVDSDGFNLKSRVDGDVEIVEKAALDVAKYPVTVYATGTFYPDADPETNSVDGDCYAEHSGGTNWATIVADTGDIGYDSETQHPIARFDAYNVSPTWRYLMRGIFLFYTASIGAESTINSATMSIYGSVKHPGNTGTVQINIYASDPASNTAIVAGDFDSLGATAFCDSPIGYAAYTTAGYNDFALNASGLAAISKTSVTKLGTREAYHDVGGNVPSWVSLQKSGFNGYHSEQGAGYKPKLVVEYDTPSGGGGGPMSALLNQGLL